MSGFVGILHRDGRPVSSAQLAALAEALRARRPDGLVTWQRGAIGLAHGRVVTNAARDAEPQPVGLRDRFWIVGHVRLDARDDLVAALEGSGTHVARDTQDAALVLLAYGAWGSTCVERISGDFSFAIWDESQRRLFCARDRFGVRPFFFAQFGELFVFGNTLAGVRQHERVSARLYEPALADYLAAGHLLEVDKTFFVDIARLPPAHCLTVERTCATARRYWTLPVEPELHYRDERQYGEQFAQVLSQALADRRVPGATGLFMSGGIDSTLLATIGAGQLGGARGEPLGGLCVGAGASDREPEFARVAARALGMPLEILDEPGIRPFIGWQRPEGAGPEPDYNPYRNTLLKAAQQLARSTRVAVNGQGGDEVLWPEYALDEARRVGAPGLASGVLRAWRATGRRPALGLRLWLERLLGRQPEPWPTLPPWLNAHWACTTRIAERFRAFAERAGARPALPRATARERLTGVLWTPYLESHDAGITGVDLEVRWPYLDERVVRFALRLPAFPWCADKHLSRQLLQDRLPDEIVRRRKAVVTADPLLAFVKRHPDWHAALEPAGALPAYVDLALWRADCDEASRGSGPAALDTWARARVIGLNYWLGHQERGRCQLPHPASDLDRSSRSPHERQYA